MLKKTRLLLVLVAIASSACGLMPPEPKAMYSGAPRPLSDVAVIAEGARGWLYVEQIDEMYVVDPNLGAARLTQGLQVLPGRRVVKVKYFAIDAMGAGAQANNITHANSEATLELDAKAGHSYVLIANRDGARIQFELKDVGTHYNQACLTSELYSKKYLRHEAVPGC